MEKYSFLWLLFGIALFNSCRKDPQPPIPEQELITTLKLTLTDTVAPYSTQTFVFTDIDGDGGMPAIVDTIMLKSGKTYKANLLLLDERNFPADTINSEIEALNTEHQFFYQAIPNTIISQFSYSDFDSNGMPLGLMFYCSTNAIIQNGSLKIILRHQPNKNGINVAAGDITNANGETDIEVDFPVKLN